MGSKGHRQELKWLEQAGAPETRWTLRIEVEVEGERAGGVAREGRISGRWAWCGLWVGAWCGLRDAGRGSWRA